MIELREIIKEDLADTLEGEFRLPFVLISPDGERQENPIIVNGITEISFDSSDDSINSVDLNFYRLEISEGDIIRISGTVSNDGDYTAKKIYHKKVTVEESVTDESAGASVTAQNLSAPLVGQILFDTLVDDLTQGMQVIVHKPVVTVRRKSLSRIPESGENWFVEIPREPNSSADKVAHVLEKPSEEGASIGFIRLYLNRAVQS